MPLKQRNHQTYDVRTQFYLSSSWNWCCLLPVQDYAAKIWVVQVYLQEVFKCFNEDDAISSLNGKPQKLVDQLTYLVSNMQVLMV